MHTSTTTPEGNTWTKAAQVIVDWTQPQSAPEMTGDETVDRAALMEWIRTYPQRSAIHVYLRSSLSNQKNRKLQSTLQSLGCRVTSRNTQRLIHA
jgi:Lon protease-like protein